MTGTCTRCGKSLSLLGGLVGDTCSECQATIEIERAKGDFEQGKRSYEAAVRGVASHDDAVRLARDGYLIVGGRLVPCPVCGNEHFEERAILMNTRAATLVEVDWADRGADARICRRCRYVMMFAQ
jgi:hypothetical protein